MAFKQVHTHDPSSPVQVFATRNIIFPAHWHEDAELLFMLEGTLGVRLDGTEHLLAEGDCVCIPPRGIHAYSGGDGKLIIYIFPPLPVLPTGIPDQALFPLGCTLRKDDGLLRPLAEIGLALKAKPYPGRGMALSGIAGALYGIFAADSEQGAQGKAPKAAAGELLPGGSASGVRRALRYMEDHFAAKVSLDAASRAAGLSSWYLSRSFSRLTGLRFIDWIIERRVAEAERLLADSDMTITEIAEEAGFGSIRAMDRAFKERRGRPPRSYLASTIC
jgi:AraC-like DNA-binding protein